MSARLALALVFVIGASAGRAAAQTLRADKAITPDGTEVLAEGPLEVSVTWEKDGRSKRDDCTLMFLTRKAFYVRDKDGANYVCDAYSGTSMYGRAITIETRNRVPAGGGAVAKMVWTRETVRGANPPRFQYDGKPIPPPPIDLTPAAVDPKNLAAVENWLLYCALEQLQSRLDTALLSGDRPTFGTCTAQTKRVVEYMTAAPGADPKLREGYERLAGYLKAQGENRDEVRKLFEEHADVVKKLQQQAQEAQAQLMQRRASLSRNPFGFIGSSFALSQAMNAYELEKRRLELAMGSLGGRSKEMLEALTKAFEAVRKERWTSIRGIGVDRFGLPLESPFEALRGLGTEKAEGLQDLLALLEKRAEIDRQFGKAAGAGDNPFALRDLFVAKVGAIEPTDKGRGVKLFDLARQMVEAARLLPAGAVFDFDRADLLRSAASLACLAATAETKKGEWSWAFSPRAAYAVRLLDRCASLDGTKSLAAADPTGQLREQRGVALLLVGQAEEAYQQAREIEKLRDSPASHVTLARLLVAREKRTDDDALRALQHLDAAFRGGFTDVYEIWTQGKQVKFDGLRPDFTGMKRRPKELKVLFEAVSRALK
jgi:hypothetical protein